MKNGSVVMLVEGQRKHNKPVKLEKIDQTFLKIHPGRGRRSVYIN